MENKIKIGLFGIGLDTYWSQFDGLLDKLKSFQLRIKDRLEQSGTSGSFSEFYVMDFNDDIILIGHISSRINKLAELLDIGFLRIC
jgi:hypothetical protein